MSGKFAIAVVLVVVGAPVAGASVDPRFLSFDIIPERYDGLTGGMPLFVAMGGQKDLSLDEEFPTGRIDPLAFHLKHPRGYSVPLDNPIELVNHNVGSSNSSSQTSGRPSFAQNIFAAPIASTVASNSIAQADPALRQINNLAPVFIVPNQVIAVANASVPGQVLVYEALTRSSNSVYVGSTYDLSLWQAQRAAEPLSVTVTPITTPPVTVPPVTTPPVTVPPVTVTPITTPPVTVPPVTTPPVTVPPVTVTPITTPPVTVPPVTTPPVTVPPVTVTPITTPSVTIPSVTTPAVTLPSVTLSSVTTPVVTTPAVTLPSVTTPVVTTPAVTLPSVTTPVVTTPAVTFPSVTTPVVTTPAVTFPSVTTPVVTTPAVTLPSVTTPVVTTPAVTIPAETTSVVTTPAVAIPVEATPAMTIPAAATSIMVQSAVASPLLASTLVPSDPTTLETLDTAAPISSRFAQARLSVNFALSDNVRIARGTTPEISTFDFVNRERSEAPVSVNAVPEPTTWAMMLIGLAGLALYKWRRSRLSQPSAS